MATKKGCNPYSMSAGYSLNTWSALDVIGGVLFLVPFVGLLAPGSHSLDQDSFYRVLIRWNNRTQEASSFRLGGIDKGTRPAQSCAGANPSGRKKRRS